MDGWMDELADELCVCVFDSRVQQISTTMKCPSVLSPTYLWMPQPFLQVRLKSHIHPYNKINPTMLYFELNITESCDHKLLAKLFALDLIWFYIIITRYQT